MSTTALPNKPSALIRVALADLRKVEVDPRYRVHMSNWHLPQKKGEESTCYVCLAGSVMAKTFEVPPSELRSPGWFDAEVMRALHALDDFRSGEVHEGLSTLEISFDEDAVPFVVDVRRHEDDSEGFHQDMNALADLLETHGL